MTTFLSARRIKKKSLPARDSAGQFIKTSSSSSELSEFTSEDSSPLDTPEINKRTLLDNNELESEHEVTKQLEEREDDEESLPEAPGPDIIIPIPELSAPIPVPTTQSLHQFTVPVQSQPSPMAATPAPAMFSGNDNENPQNFLREVERYVYPPQ
ncbi:hypothetical protein BDR03DRAFT_1018272 [Suillus americanus]|nr:hypothetical protein BDR03DRAFT_1018272 [Suillus americanus]